MSTYTPTAGDQIAAGSHPVTELASRVGGFIAGCGQAALAVVLGAASGNPPTVDYVTSLIKSSVNAHVTTGNLAGSGQSSPATLQWLAQQQGVQLQSMDAQTAIQSYAGKKDIIVGVNNATVFGGADSNIYGHYITIVGIKPNGNLIVSDPNTAESQRGAYVEYTQAQLATAHPFWAAVATGASGIQIPNPFQGGADLASSVGSIAQSLQGGGLILGKTFDALGGWITNPMRIVKLVVGLGLIFLSILLTFLPDAAEAATAAVGLPELAPVVGNATSKLGGPQVRVAPTVRSGAQAMQQAQNQQQRQQQRVQRRAAVRTVAARTAAAPRPPRATVPRPPVPSKPVQVKPPKPDVPPGPLVSDKEAADIAERDRKRTSRQALRLARKGVKQAQEQRALSSKEDTGLRDYFKREPGESLGGSLDRAMRDLRAKREGDKS